MRLSATGVFLLALICFQAVSAVSLRKSASTTSVAIERLRLVGKTSKVAHEIVSAVELHLTSGGKVDDVILLVQKALDDVKARRHALSGEYGTKKQNLEDIIGKTNSLLVDARKELSDTEADIKRLEGEISALDAKISGLNDELLSLEQREALINKARDSDVKTYGTRKLRDENSISAIQTIIEKLKNLEQRGGSFLEVSSREITHALNRIPKSNPIQALVQLSTQFNAEKLATIIGKLETILKAIQNSYEDDRKGEVVSQDHYNALIAEIKSIREQKNADLTQANLDISKAKVDKTAAETKRDNLNADINIKENLVKTTQDELDQANITYPKRISDADESINGVEAALNVLNTNRVELQKREERADQLNSQQSTQ